MHFCNGILKACGKNLVFQKILTNNIFENKAIIEYTPRPQDKQGQYITNRAIKANQAKKIQSKIKIYHLVSIFHTFFTSKVQSEIIPRRTPSTDQNLELQFNLNV